MAALALREGYSASCLFHCQQAIEKAVWAEHESTLPPRTHDLVYLAERMKIAPSEAQFEFLRLLSEQYVPTRYPDAPPGIPTERVAAYMSETKELYSWLQQHLS